MSVDPDVAATDQPYVFTNDDPLNVTDSLGMAAAALMGGGVVSPKEAVTVAVAMTIDALKSEGASISSEAMSDISKALSEDLSKPGEIITSGELGALEWELVDSVGHIGKTLGFLGVMAIGLNDLAEGHGLAYALTDDGASVVGAVGGGALGAAYCGGPLDPVDAGCVIIGAVVGGNVVPAAYHSFINLWKGIF